MTDTQNPNPNPNVIISTNSHSDGKHYHTDICRNVWQIVDKTYVTEAAAKRRGCTECSYCADDYEIDNGDRTHYEALVAAAEAE